MRWMGSRPREVEKGLWMDRVVYPHRPSPMRAGGLSGLRLALPPSLARCLARSLER